MKKYIIVNGKGRFWSELKYGEYDDGWSKFSVTFYDSRDDAEMAVYGGYGPNKKEDYSIRSVVIGEE